MDQVKDLSDHLKLLIYEDIYHQNFVCNIPVVEKTVYEDNREYYDEKVVDFILSNELKENRMISDEVQCRFINTVKVDNFYLKKTLKQTFKG